MLVSQGLHERRAVGSVVAGKFRIEAELGAGTGGAVYRAAQEALSRTVALKILADDRSEREARAIAKLKHENVVAVFDVGDAGDGARYLAMEFVDGCTLRALMDRRELSIDEARAVALGIARALAHAHAAGVVHRDLKPENVMLEGERADARSVRVVDFGLAHVASVAGAGASVTSTIAGTPAYMAPERAEPKSPHVEPASDVYALGVVLYEMLTGTNPFRAETTLKTLLRHVEGPVPLAPSTLRADAAPLDALVLAMLAKDPAARAPLARVLDLLEAPPSAPRALAVDAAPVAVSRRNASPLALGAIVAVVAALVVVVAVVVAAGVGTRSTHVVGADAGRTTMALAAEDAGSSTMADAGSSSTIAAGAGSRVMSTDAGSPTMPADAGSSSRPDAAHSSRRAKSDAGVNPPSVEKPSSALQRKAAALRSSCTQPCAAETEAQLARAVDGGLEALKQWKADFETCRVLCAKR